MSPSASSSSQQMLSAIGPGQLSAPPFRPGGFSPSGLPSPGAPLGGSDPNFMGSGRGQTPRRSRGGPPVHAPLKTSGHNSTPSMQLNPADFAAMLASGTAGNASAAASKLKKKKFVVTLPDEDTELDQAKKEELEELQAEEEDASDILREEDSGLAKDPEDSSGGHSTTAASRAERRARLAALQGISRTRALWVRRVPVSVKSHLTPPAIPEENIATCEVYPESWDIGQRGLPDTIDIYLPAWSAWVRYVEDRKVEIAEERKDAEARAEDPFQAEEPAHTEQVPEVSCWREGCSDSTLLI